MVLALQKMPMATRKEERRRKQVPRVQSKATANKALKVQKEQDTKCHQLQASKAAHRIMTMAKRKRKLRNNQRNLKIEQIQIKNFKCFSNKIYV